MAEVDRLSNSGLYPALPIADKRGGSGNPQRPLPEKGGKPEAEKPDTSATGSHPRPPKSIIDEYA
jgi:hypothetical protein